MTNHDGSQMICERLPHNDIRKSRLNLEDAEEIWVAGIWIEITSTPCNFGGRRYWYLCPFCNRRCAILYPKACRICLKASYESERLSPLDRMIHKAYKLRGRFPFEPNGLMAQFPIKPRTMHWKTYHRLRLKSRALETAIYDAEWEKLVLETGTKLKIR